MGKVLAFPSGKEIAIVKPCDERDELAVTLMEIGCTIERLRIAQERHA